MMIKKYNAFVEGKVNEEFVMADTRPGTTEVSPGTIEKPGVMPETPTPIRKDRTSPVPAPAKMEVEQEEEEGGDKYKKIITDLAAQLGTEVSEDGTIDYNGQKINFYSETDMFHVGKKKFKTADEVVSYLEDSKPSEEVEIEKDHSPSKEDMDELMNAHDDDDFIKEEEEKFESKSYKSTRKFESFKNKKK